MNKIIFESNCNNIDILQFCKTQKTFLKTYVQLDQEDKNMMELFSTISAALLFYQKIYYYLYLKQAHRADNCKQAMVEGISLQLVVEHDIRLSHADLTSKTTNLIQFPYSIVVYMKQFSAFLNLLTVIAQNTSLHWFS